MKMKRAFTLIELMVAMTLSLLLLLAVARMFHSVGDTINDTQATLNMAANMNNVAMILREDIDAIFRCVQVNRNHRMVTNGDHHLYEEEGYLEIREGTNNPNRYVDENGERDTTIGDVNDILMGTGKVIGANRAYRGLINDVVYESNFAEIVWFVRGTTLYRQARLIIGDDGNTPTAMPAGMIHDNDVSISQRNTGSGTESFFNTLSTLARRENRFAYHCVGQQSNFPFPHNPRYSELRLPTMAELSGNIWGGQPEPASAPVTIDLWNDPNYATGETIQEDGWIDAGDRAGEDIVLTNVISFDIRVWNPVANAFVDLGDGSDGAFGSRGRYCGGSVSQEHLPHESLVTRVNFDENRDRSERYQRDPTTGEYIFDANGDRVEVPTYHHSYYDRLYREGSQGQDIPLSNLASDINAVSPPSPPLPPTTPETTLTIGAWSGAAMPRVFDTWTKYYENYPHNNYAPNGAEVYGFTNDIPNGDLYRQIIGITNPADQSNRFPLHPYSRAEFYLVTFRPEQLPSPMSMNRWHYEHSANEKYDPGPPPSMIPVADRFFDGYQHRGTGMYDSIDRNSGAYWECPPPYDAELRGIEITIRCFDPKSGNIRQVRVVKHVNR
ncbi:MAG: prepilin-type N-terminal cleavage/methylation domain-containing protein [Planctomycetaceae bacterium]|jgi:prepilin-type N-terminal cleavage/methylation domain-containing protein|nr:prepilin-type N-terminal cleavage/methylation domain-containing protein [Planctomycetaceae bacterium]